MKNGDASSAAPLIMVVDDDLDIRNTVAGILRDEGYRVTKAANGLEALRQLTAEGAELPALILLDMMMPIMDGSTFREEQQKQTPPIAAVPIVTFTAFGAPAQIDISWAAGRLGKPLRLEALLTIVTKHAGAGVLA
jgi:CheY-like chemotaxis protein